MPHRATRNGRIPGMTKPACRWGCNRSSNCLQTGPFGDANIARPGWLAQLSTPTVGGHDWLTIRRPVDKSAASCPWLSGLAAGQLTADKRIQYPQPGHSSRTRDSSISSALADSAKGRRPRGWPQKREESRRTERLCYQTGPVVDENAAMCSAPCLAGNGQDDGGRSSRSPPLGYVSNPGLHLGCRASGWHAGSGESGAGIPPCRIKP